MPLLGTLLAAFALALFTYTLARLFTMRPRLARGLADFYAAAGTPQMPASRGERFGAWVLERLPFSFDAWEAHLQWAQRGGCYTGWGMARLLSTAILLGAGAAAFWFINPAPAGLLLPIAATAYPFISVRARANTTRKRVVRSLPEAASLVAAEVAAGISPEQALERATVLPGPLSGLLEEAIGLSRRAGRPLFGRRPVRGLLVEVFTQAGLPELLAFAVQLDLVAEKGVAGASLMNEVAQTLSREYRARLEAEVEKLNGRLVLATAVFFFIPFVAIILGAFFLPVMQIFGV
jgi:Flp pilus assembly protein TadB